MSVSQGRSTEKEEGGYFLEDARDDPCTFKLIISGANILNIEVRSLQILKYLALCISYSRVRIKLTIAICDTFSRTG